MSVEEMFCDIAPSCHYKAAIRIYPTDKALQKANLANGGNGEAQAFCVSQEGKEDRLTTLHFYIGEMPPSLVAHEVFHAVMELVRMFRLDMEDDYAQEMAAHSVGHLMEKVQLAKKLYRDKHPRH